MKKVLCIIFCSIISLDTFAQNECAVLLSEAEEGYRNGELYKILPISKCFGTYYKKKKNHFGPRRITKLTNDLIKYDSLYSFILVDFQNFGKDILANARKLPNENLIFTKEERRRAYILLGKTYQSLGAIKSSKLVARRLLIEHPTVPLTNDNNLSFQKIYNEELKRARKHSIGVILGWLYTIPIATRNNREIRPDFKWQSVGSVLLGVHYNYFLNPSWTFSTNFWWHNTKIEYKETNISGDAVFFHQENQNWIKFPFLFKFSNPKTMSWLKNNEDLAAQWYLQGGFSINYLTSAKANISVPQQQITLTNYSVRDGRNLINAELLLGIGSKFRFGRNYITVSFNGALGLRNVVNQDEVGTNENRLFENHSISENNYRTLSGFYAVTYEVIFNKLRKNR
jgi:hypothetical protein